MVLSCGDEERDPLPNWSDGYEDGADGGTPGGAGSGGTMALVQAADVPYPVRIYDLDRPDEPCAIAIEGTLESREEITCQMEVKELDLYAVGLAFDLHISQGACEYLWYRHYEYEAFEVGYGPTDVSYTIDANGSITNEVNSSGGEPYCEYDYSDLGLDWPNCCLGRYTLTVTNEGAGGEVTVHPPKWWGGNPCDCHDGAAHADDEAVFNEDRCPMATILYLNWAAFSKPFRLGSISDDYFTNVPYANYYDPADHDGTRPAGLREDGPLGPSAIRWPYYYPWPYYTFVCTDDADEIFGSIRLIVREWNEAEEFFKPNNSGNPDTEGTEPGTAYLLNDVWDWKDATPGSDVWILDGD